MGRRHDRARVNLRGGGRHSRTMADGRGDPRDHRREAQRLTDDFVDPAFFRIVNGRLTLAIDQKGMAALTSSLAGAGLAVSEDGRLTLNLLTAKKVQDSSGGTASDTLAEVVDPADAPATADALREDLVDNVLPALRNALATLAARLNSILEQPNSPTRTS